MKIVQWNLVSGSIGAWKTYGHAVKTSFFFWDCIGAEAACLGNLDLSCVEGEHVKHRTISEIDRSKNSFPRGLWGME